VLGLHYAYTTTGILRELPTIANGGVRRRPVSGYLDATGEFTATVTSQPTTTDQLVVTFHWNPALRWADGQAVTAGDSRWAYEAARRAPASPEAEALLDMIERYEELDPTTTRATLKPGRTDASYLLAAWPPAPRHLLEGATPEARDKYARAPLGYGPYTFAEAKPGDSITLTRNPFWPVKGLPEQLWFHFFGSEQALQAAVNRGAVDVAVLEHIPAELYRSLDGDAQKGAIRVTYLRGPVYEHLDFNLDEPLFQDLRVRRAFAYALNRQGMVDELAGGKTTPLESWILPDQPEYAGDEQLQRYPYDVAKARSLLDEAGLVDQNRDGIREARDGKPISLTLLTTDTPERLDIARRIERNLRVVGIPLRTQGLPVDELYSPTGPLFRRQFQLAEFAWIASVEPSGLPLWSCGAIPGAANSFRGNNFAGWCFEPAEGPLRAAARSFDERASAAAYLRHQQLWTRQLPSVPLFQRPIAIVQRAGLQGIVPDPLAPITWNVDMWKR
jgi:peptide/nickel transport system substrate-binding protein